MAKSVAVPSKSKSDAKSSSNSSKPAAEPVESVKAPRASKSAAPATAVEMGARQREISVSEFFTKNRHLLGFDNPRKALLT